MRLTNTMTKKNSRPAQDQGGAQVVRLFWPFMII
jgi:hypothetical protein